MIKKLKIVNENAKILALVLFVFVSIGSYGQGRAYIRQQIAEQGECKSVAITKSKGDLMLYGRNGWAGVELPSELSSSLKKLKRRKKHIDDVQLTEDGRWLILWEGNGIRWNYIPDDLEQRLHDYNKRREAIASVTFNDDGDWIIITDNYYVSSAQWITSWLKDGTKEFGELWTACITDDGMVAVYARGYQFFGDVPESLKEALGATDLDVYRLKVAGTSWFFADRDGGYHYNM